jgi:hypothetical protein
MRAPPTSGLNEEQALYAKGETEGKSSLPERLLERCVSPLLEDAYQLSLQPSSTWPAETLDDNNNYYYRKKRLGGMESL